MGGKGKKITSEYTKYKTLDPASQIPMKGK